MTESPDTPVSADKAYWAEIFRVHQRSMWVAAIRRLGREKSHLGHNAESVVQEVLVRLINRGEVIHADNVEAYLVTAVKNLATDILRQQAGRKGDHLARQDEADDYWKEPSAEDVAEGATNVIIREQTRKVLETMEEGPRRAFIERVMEGHPFTKIGREMGISDVQAGRLYRRAVKEIQEKLGVNLGQGEIGMSGP